MDVPYYHRRIPEEFFQGKGWRGWLIRLLNRLRWRIERFVSYLTMILIAKDVAGLDKDSIAALKERFDQENDEARTSRRKSLAALGLLATEGNRYSFGRKNSTNPEDELPVSKTEGMFARLMNTSRYTHGRGYAEMTTFQTDVPEVDLKDS